MSDKNKLTILVTKDEESEWVSCNSISQGLQEAYLLIENKLIRKVSACPLEKVGGNLAKIAEQDFSEVERFVFVEYKPHPYFYIDALLKMKKIDPDTEFVFHLYGDFILFSSLWVKVLELLKDYNVFLFVASSRQKCLVEKLIQSNTLRVLPFIVDSKKFHFDEIKRNRFREKYKVSDDEELWLYSGRISIQKNILTIIKSFQVYLKQINPMAKLVIAGEFDDLGKPYIGQKSSFNTMSYLVGNMCGEGLQSKILFLGSVDHESLLDVYNGADYFISLSTHNDEDFGMSPLEALSCGVPCLLTNWGGYFDFYLNVKEGVELVNVQVTQDHGPIVRSEQIVEKMIKITSNNYNRNEISRQTKEIYGGKTISEKLKRELENNERESRIEILPNFYFIASMISNNSSSPFGNGRGGYNSSYVELYKDY